LPSTIEPIHQELKDQGLTILAVNMGESRAVVAKWVRDKGVATSVLLDSDRAVTRAYGVTGTPTVYLVSRAGQMVGKAFGQRSWTSDAGRALLAALLAQPTQ
jgi:cytochrome c biogenesis protein CcmG, thiol:disulfide interchange protein DsbE